MDPLKTLPEDEFGKAILLRLNRQLLGNILPSQRGLTVGWKHNHDSVQLLAYFDRAPTETDRDAINEVAAEMEGEIGFSVSEKRFVIQVEPLCLQSAQPFAQLEMLNCWAHFRYENAAIQYPL